MSVLPYVIRKEFLQLRRDRKMLPIVLIAPVFQLILLGYAANLDVRSIPTALFDRDKTEASRELAAEFYAGGYFQRSATVSNPAEAEQLLLSDETDAVLSVPTGFEADLRAGRPVELQLLVDGTNSTVGTAAQNYSRAVVDRFARSRQRAQQAAGGAQGGSAPGGGPPIEVRSRVFYNPQLESRNFFVPGLLALLLMIITMLLSSLAIVKEKEIGTLEQLNVTPIRPRELIVGKLIPFIIIGFIDVLLVLLVSQVLFGVPFRGSLLLLLCAAALFLGTTLGLGLLISTVSSNQQQAMMTSVFFVMIPMLFLSGFAFPIESMPTVVQWVTYVLPLRYFFTIIRGVFLKGAGLAVLWDELLILLLFGVGILSLAAARFRKRAA
jgi:ABC-2 type transport system permease protein